MQISALLPILTISLAALGKPNPMAGPASDVADPNHVSAAASAVVSDIAGTGAPKRPISIDQPSLTTAPAYVGVDRLKGGALETFTAKPEVKDSEGNVMQFSGHGDGGGPP